MMGSGKTTGLMLYGQVLQINIADVAGLQYHDRQRQSIAGLHHAPVRFQCSFTNGPHLQPTEAEGAESP